MDMGGSVTVPPETANAIGKADTVVLDKARELTKYHAADPLQIERMGRVRMATENLILIIVNECPSNSDRSAAIRKARECLMTANASIVLPVGVSDFR